MKDKEKWFGIVRWCDDDIRDALKEGGYEVTDENVEKIKNLLKHHSFTDMMIETGWDVINQTISENLENDFRFCSCCGKKIYEGYTNEEEYWCEDCFRPHMDKMCGKGRWSATSKLNKLDGFYYFLNDYGDWEPLNIYWTEWRN